jgi:hypothetical protein
MRSRSLRLIILPVLLIAISILAVSCKIANNTAATNALTDLPVENDKAITQVVSAQKGGWIYYNDAYQEVAVFFQPGSLAKDTEVVLTPIQRLSVGVSDVIEAGFVIVDKKTKQAPALKKPVALAFKLPDSDPNVMIFKYLPADGAYEPIKSRLITSRGSNVLMAGVSSFSAYGVKKPIAKDKKKIANAKESIFNGTLIVDADTAAPVSLTMDAGPTTITSHMKMSVGCPEAVIRGGVYKGVCAATGEAVWGDTQEFNLSGTASMDYLLPSKSTDRPKTLPANLRQEVESRAEGRGYIEFGTPAAALSVIVTAAGSSLPVDLRPSEDGGTWPFKVFMVPGTDNALVVTAFGFFMGKFETTKAAQ